MNSHRSKKRHRAAVIIIRDARILLIYRFRAGHEYYVIPGGGVHKTETVEQAAHREIEEETGLKIEKLTRFCEFENLGQAEYYFLTTKFSGKPEFGGPELKKMSPDNVYRLEWVSLDELNRYPLLPQKIKQKIIDKIDSFL